MSPHDDRSRVPPEREALSEFARFLAREAHRLVREPALALQQAINSASAEAPARAAEQRLARLPGPPALVRRLHRPRRSPGARVTLVGHRGWVNAWAFSPDGALLASGSQKEEVLRLWRTATGEPLPDVPACGEVTSCAFSPDGRLLAIGRRQRGESVCSLILWSLAHGTIESVLYEQRYAAASCLAFSSDGALLLAGIERYQGELRLYEVTGGRELGVFTGFKAGVSRCALSPNGAWLAGASRYGIGQLKVWQFDEPGPTHALEGGGHEGLAFAPAGDRLYFSPFDTGTDDYEKRYADVAELALASGRIRPITEFGPRPQTLRASSEDELRDPTSSLLEHWSRESPDERPPAWPGLSPNGRLRASIDNRGGDGTITLLSVCVGVPNASKPSGPGGAITSLELVAAGDAVATGALDGSVRVWDLATGVAIVRLARSFAIAEVAPHPRADTLLVRGEHDRFLALWDWRADPQGHAGRFLGGLDEEHPWRSHIHAAGISAAALSPDGSRVVSASGTGTRGEVWLWDTAAAEFLRALEGHTGHVRALSFADGGSRLVSADERTLCVWDPAELRPLATVSRAEAFIGAWALSPGDVHVAAAFSDGAVEIWDVRGAARAAMLLAPAAIGSCAFSPNGGRLAFGDDRGTLRVWRWTDNSGPEVEVRAGSFLRRCHFFPGGGKVACWSASNDRTHVVELPEGRIVATLEDQFQPEDFSPDGQVVAGRSRAALVFRATADLRRLVAYPDASGPSRWLSPRRLAVGDHEGLVHLLELQLPGSSP